MQKLLYLSNQPANIYIQKLPVCFPTIVLTCCFNTRFFTPSITNCDPVFMTRDKRLGAKEEDCTKYKLSLQLQTKYLSDYTIYADALCAYHLCFY